MLIISFKTLAVLIAASPSLLELVQAQTWSLCNPMEKDNCPKDPALGGNYEHVYGGAAPGFETTGSPSMVKYESDGAHFIVEKTNDSPTITSNFYIMYGKLDCDMLAAPGKGIVSSLVFQSDTLDEIDWEWIGSDQGQAQSNYFGKGNTETYDRGGFHPVNHQEYHRYGIEWTPEFVKWSIDGNVVRTLTPAEVKGDFYPQTPMQIKVGSWSAGDPNNAPGVIEWSQGPTDYNAGPFHMIVKSLKIQDYSTGTYYVYTDRSGSAASIKSEGGEINAGPNLKPGNTPETPKENIDDDDEGDDEEEDEDDGATTTYKAPSNSGRKTSTAAPSSTPDPDEDVDDEEDFDDEEDDDDDEDDEADFDDEEDDDLAPTKPSGSPLPSGISDEIDDGTSKNTGDKPEEANSDTVEESEGGAESLKVNLPIFAVAGLVGVGLVL